MLDRWFLEDVKKALAKNGRLVLIDPGSKASFLKSILKKHRSGVIFDVKNQLDEVKLKYEIEKNYRVSCRICG